MNKKSLKQLRTKLIALSLSGLTLSLTGCASLEDGLEEMVIIDIPDDYSNIKDYYKYSTIDGKNTKEYKAQNIYLLCNKKTQDVRECIYATKKIFGPLQSVELYDLNTEDILVYGNGIGSTLNQDYYDYLMENTYQICYQDISNYIEGVEPKDYYTLKEIKELEPIIINKINTIKKKSLKI